MLRSGSGHRVDLPGQVLALTFRLALQGEILFGCVERLRLYRHRVPSSGDSTRVRCLQPLRQSRESLRGFVVADGAGYGALLADDHAELARPRERRIE